MDLIAFIVNHLELVFLGEEAAEPLILLQLALCNPKLLHCL